VRLGPHPARPAAAMLTRRPATPRLGPQAAKTQVAKIRAAKIRAAKIPAKIRVATIRLAAGARSNFFPARQSAPGDVGEPLKSLRPAGCPERHARRSANSSL